MTGMTAVAEDVTRVQRHPAADGDRSSLVLAIGPDLVRACVFGSIASASVWSGRWAVMLRMRCLAGVVRVGAHDAGLGGAVVVELLNAPKVRAPPADRLRCGGILCVVGTVQRDGRATRLDTRPRLHPSPLCPAGRPA